MKKPTDDPTVETQKKINDVLFDIDRLRDDLLHSNSLTGIRLLKSAIDAKIGVLNRLRTKLNRQVKLF